MSYTSWQITVPAILVGIILLIALRRGLIKTPFLTDLASIATVVGLILAFTSLLSPPPDSNPSADPTEVITSITVTTLPLADITASSETTIGGVPENMATEILIATNTPLLVPTNTAISLPTNTFTPVPTATEAAPPTATPVPLPTPTPVPVVSVCNLSASPIFYDFYQNHRESLGCPMTDQIVINTISEQMFQGGHLYWRKDKNIVYIVYDRQIGEGEIFSGRWEKNIDEALGRRWDWGEAGEPEPDGIGLTPPPNMFEPVRGFGWLWRNYLGRENGPLGWGLAVAYGRDNLALAQEFENGIMFKASDPLVYVLLNNGQFYSAR